MGKIGCSVDGNLNDAKFGEPLPWIGIYVAVASLVCAIVMAADVIRGFRHRKLWFPSKYFCINATSLAIIAVAVKFSVDLNTPMPRRVDQLSKLSSNILICTMMGNSMPSLGTMENQEIMMNIIALGILVITVTVNICIQLGTGVIYLYWKEHALIMFLMLVLLVILSFSALTVPTTKRYLEFKFKKKYEMAVKECSTESNRTGDKKLREDLMKFWMMAHTSSPQFVMARLVTCTAAGALCLLGAMTLAEAMLRSYLMPWSFKFCTGESDYKWSTILVLVAQTIAIGVGTIAPAIRWFTAVNFRCPTLRKKSCRGEFKLERYWIQFLVELKECPFTLRIHNRHCRKLAHDAKNQILDLCIGMQTGIVLASKAIRLISVYFISRILLFCVWCRKLKFKSNNISIDSGRESQSSSKPDLSRFVLHLEGENQLVELMMKSNRDATEHWILKGKKKQPRHLIELLEKSSEGLHGVSEFDSNLVHSLDSEEPKNCWSLPVVTLTAIATAIPNINNNIRKQLKRSVHEGLIYVKHIEDNLETEDNMNNIRKAAYTVWLGIEMYHKWLDVDLNKLCVQAESTKEILEGLADAAKNRYIEFKKTYVNQCLLKESPSKWPINVLAANSMYRISQTILQNYEISCSHNSDRLFETLTVMISDILLACFTNFKHIISLKCMSSSVEIRAESVRHAAFLLGETEGILKLLNQKELPRLGPDEMACIEDWRALQQQKNHLPLPLSSPETDAASSVSYDLHLTID
ncbi:hypothetical protein JCGZ_03388 [Jatropha curcas]|uniref:Uncharacterized protein n=1 Tax=Jatropha curcas TaxID=180498 RepID=A0A067KUP4_JATCU|nr:uncharacterized protein LOC105632253 [Jatropha curcas]KDP39857.1 hypothetical protein JCGZ_03388 [Jatropha curcas]